MEDGVLNCPSHDGSGQSPHHIQVCLNIPYRHSIDTVAVGGRMDGTDGPGEAIVSHGGHLFHLHFIKLSIGDDCTNGGISSKYVSDTGVGVIKCLLRALKTIPCGGKHTGQLRPVVAIENIP